MLPHQRLLEWFTLEDERKQLAQVTSLFTADAELDAEPLWDQLQHTSCLREVRALFAHGDATHGVVVVDGRDPVTNLWHRMAWAFSARDGLISKITSTTSQGLPLPDALRRNNTSGDSP
jgi:hypothetical protein